MTTTQHACSTHAAYKLSCEEFDALWNANGGGCWRCGANGVRLEIDHDHSRGVNAVRGLLCGPCNGHMASVDAGVVDPFPVDAVYLAEAWHAERVVEYVRDIRTPGRKFRVDDRLWEEAKRISAERRETLSAVIKRALVEYVEKHGGRLDDE